MAAQVAGRARRCGGAGLTWAIVQAYLGDLLDLPEWVRGLSPYRHLALPPAEEFAWTPVLVQLTIVVVLAGLGPVGWLRRDLR